MKLKMEKIQCKKCKNTVVIDGSFSNKCGKCGKCGTEYNALGQELAPRSEWGWETGEHF